MPYLCRTATQKPYASICNLCIRTYPHGYHSGRVHYITAGIYRCPILDIDMKSLREISKHQESARINAIHICYVPKPLKLLNFITASRSRHTSSPAGASALRSATAKLQIISEIPIKRYEKEQLSFEVSQTFIMELKDRQVTELYECSAFTQT